MSEDIPQGQKTILNLYAAFGVSLILSVLPYMAAGGLSLIFFTGVLIAAYMVRKKAQEHDFADNHTTFIIRTIWIGALFSLVTTAIASAYMLGGIDYSQFQPCADALAAKGIEWVESAGFADVYELTKPCMNNFIQSNHTLLMNAMIIAGGPILLYMTYRLAKGVTRATKGYRLADDKVWF
ncbi:MAG: hypothetical protein AAF204_02475 [Pseudomonadota bacterium]